MSQKTKGSLSAGAEAGVVVVDGPGIAMTLTAVEAATVSEVLSTAADQATEQLASRAAGAPRSPRWA